MSDNKHDKALDLTEQALDALVDDDEKVAGKLIDEAKALNPCAVEEIVEDLQEAQKKSVKPHE